VNPKFAAGAEALKAFLRLLKGLETIRQPATVIRRQTRRRGETRVELEHALASGTTS
jgi:hypothetical protein